MQSQNTLNIIVVAIPDSGLYAHMSSLPAKVVL